MKPYLLLLCTLLVGCANVEVGSDYDPSVNFSRLRTYSWVEGESTNEVLALHGLPFLDAKIRTAAENALAAKGFIAVSPRRADFLLTYSLLVSHSDVDTFSQFYRYKSTGGRDNLSGAYTAGFSEGTLVLDVVDPANWRVLWRGTASAVVDPNSNGDRAVKAIQEILERFPPQ